jgi:hypothetical protein
MDVISFLCVSLGSSTVRLHDSLGIRRECACSEAGFSSQYDPYLRLRAVLPKSRVLLSVCLWTKELGAKDIHKEMFPVYGGKCLLRKAVHSWVANVSPMTRLKRRCGNG